ncbi:MAG: hypothetical protein RI973_630 [Bacteroidota bacterium]|jgi:preprotein translocase subunit SecG
MVFLSIVIAVIALLLIAAVLIQNPKGGGVDATFGGAQATQMFGVAKSADLIEKITWILAVSLLVLCILATFLVGSGSGVENVPLQSQ